MQRFRDVFLSMAVILVGCSETPADEAARAPVNKAPRPNVNEQAARQTEQSESEAELAILARGESDEADLMAKNISAKELRQLPQLPRVKEFQFRRAVMTKDHIDAIAEKFPNLTSLTIYRLEVKPDVLASVPKLKLLRSLSISEDTFNDAALEPLRGLALTRLTINNIALTDAGMDVVGSLVMLEQLNAFDLPLTDAGIQKLAGLTMLKSLGLSHSKIGDGSLEVISGMRSLTYLGMNGTNITDAGFAKLAPLKNLEWLEAGCPGLTDRCLDVIGGWPKLKTVALGRTQITDDGLKILGQVKGVHYLQLDQTKVTDAGLVHLYGLPLGSLDLSNTPVTPAGIDKLKNAIPNIVVTKRDQITIEKLQELLQP